MSDIRNKYSDINKLSKLKNLRYSQVKKYPSTTQNKFIDLWISHEFLKK